MRISDWSSDVCSSDLAPPFGGVVPASWPVERAGKREGDHGDIAGCDRLVFNPCADEVAQRRVDLAFHLAQAFRAFGGQREMKREIDRSEEHTSELQSLMRSSYAVLCLKKKKKQEKIKHNDPHTHEITTTITYEKKLLNN